MKNIKYILIFLVFIAAGYTYSQGGKVIVRLKKPPPNKINLEDMWKLTTDNPTGITYNAYFKAVITKSGFGTVVEAATSNMVVPAGTKTVMPKDVEPVDVDEKADNIKNVLKSTGTLPNGSYEICVTLFEYETNEYLGSVCITHDVLSVSQSELITPSEDEFITAKFPSFSWTAPRPLRSTQNITYTLSIAEVLSAQSGSDALESNPEFHKASNIRSTVYQYPVSSKIFKPGKKYAWRVSCYVNNFLLSESDVREFTYRTTNDTTKGKYKSYRPGRPVFGTTGLAPAVLQLMPSTGGEFGLSENRQQLKKSAPVFFFTGTSELYGEAANRTATLSGDPQRYTDLTINPTLFIKGIPFGLNLLLSSRQQGFKQNMNMAGMQFDPATLKEMIEDKVKSYLESKKDEIEQTILEKGEKYRSQVEQQYAGKVTSKLTPLFKVFTAFKSLGIGTTYPEWTKYTLSGVPQTGLSFEFNPGIFYIAASGFKNKTALENKTYKRNIYGGRIGIGKKDNSHFFITGLYVKDFENSITVSDTSYLKPEANYIVGTEMKLNLFKNKLSIEGEVNASLYTSDVTASDIASNNIPKILKNIFNPKSTSSVDGFVSGRIAYENDKSKTKTSFKVTMIGPGYKSLASSTKANDRLEFEYKIDQKFAKNKVSVSLKVLNFRDNLIENWKNFTSTTTMGILNLTVAIPKMPRAAVIYVPLFSGNNSSNDTDKVSDRSHALTFITSYSGKIKNITSVTSLSAGITDNSTYLKRNDGYSKNITLNQSFYFKFPLTLSGSIGLVQTSDMLYGYARTVTGGISADYVIEEIWSNSAGFSADITRDLNKRLSVFLDTRLDFNEHVSLNIRTEKNLYNDWVSGANNWDEFVIKSTLSTNW